MYCPEIRLKKFTQFYLEDGRLLSKGKYGASTEAEEDVKELLTLLPAVEREAIDSEPFCGGLTALGFVTCLYVIGYLSDPNIGAITERDVEEKWRSLYCPIDPEEEIRQNEKKKAEPSPRRRHPDEGHPTNKWDRDMERAHTKGETWCEQKRQAKESRRAKQQQKKADKAARGHIVDPRIKLKIQKGEILMWRTKSGKPFPMLHRFRQ